MYITHVTNPFCTDACTRQITILKEEFVLDVANPGAVLKSRYTTAIVDNLLS